MTVSTATAPAIDISTHISEHVTKAACRLVERGWLSRIDFLAEQVADRHVYALSVPSEQPEITDPYRVCINTETQTTTCTCAAGVNDRLCKHAVLVLVKLGLATLPQPTCRRCGATLSHTCGSPAGEYRCLQCRPALLDTWNARNGGR